MSKKRPVIAFLTNSLLGEYHMAHLLTLNEAAQRLDFSLCVFCPFLFYTQKSYQLEYLQTFDLIDPEQFDGFIVSSAPLSYFFDSATLEGLYKKLSTKPLVSISQPSGFGTTVQIDNYGAFYQLTEHLIRDHGFRDLGFIAGPIQNCEAFQRHQAFYACLGDHNIDIQKVCYYEGNFGYSSGKIAAREFLKVRGSLPRAIVCANDDMALGAITEIRSLGFSVPEDVALVGFDNTEAADFEPGLTTMHQGISTQINLAVKVLFELIEGKTVSDPIFVTPEIVKRGSCGCVANTKQSQTLTRDQVIKKQANSLANQKTYSMGELTTFSKNIADSPSIESLQSNLDYLAEAMALKNLILAIYPKVLMGIDKHQTLPLMANLIYSRKLSPNQGESQSIPVRSLGYVANELRATRSTRVISELVFQDFHFGFLSLEHNEPDTISMHMINLEICNLFRAIQIKHKMDEAFEKLKSHDQVKNDFIANITHDFRSPLTITMGISELGMFEHQKEDEDFKKYQIIHEAALKLKHTIDRFLELTKIDGHAMTLNLDLHNMADFLRELKDFYASALFNTNIQLELTLPTTPLPKVWVDIEKFEQIMHNLISNAIKFVDIQRGKLYITLDISATAFIVEVADNGLGIQADKLDYIFERFAQIHHQGYDHLGGTGIGLAFCKQLVDLMGGQIWAESPGIGLGARFTIQLPRIIDALAHQDHAVQHKVHHIPREEIKALISTQIKNRQESATNTLHLSSNPNRRYATCKILVIEDDININDLECKILIHEGFSQIYRAFDGQVGLMEAQKILPDIIICDISLPNVRGDRLYAELIKDPRFATTPFIFISALADSDIKKGIQHRGKEVFLTKPIDLPLFVEALHQIAQSVCPI